MKKNYQKFFILSIISFSILTFQGNRKNVFINGSLNDNGLPNTNHPDSNTSEENKKEEIQYSKQITVYLNPSVQTKNLYVNNLGTEAQHMNDIVRYMVEELSDIEFIKLTYNLNYLSLKDSVKQSNDLKSDIHFSLHSNAGGGSGSEIYTPINNTHFGSYIYDEYTRQIDDFKKRGVKQTNTLYEINNSKAEHRVLLELLFHDNLKEAKYIIDNKQKIASVLSQGIIKYIKEFYLNIY